MKYVTVEWNGEKAGIISADGKRVLIIDEVLDFDFGSIMAFIENRTVEQERSLLKASESQKGIPLEDVRLMAPIPRAKHDIICVGVNYVSHLEETQKHFFGGRFESPEETVYFGKRASFITGPNEDIYGHLDIDSCLDYEVELAVIIGKAIDSSVGYNELSGHIFGYSIFNDISARSLQSSHAQWYLGKSLDTFSVMGPWIVSSDMIAFNGGYDIESRVNGDLRQHSNTRLMRMNVGDLLYELSRGITLEPGDIIATGTPAGVGQGFDPPRFLRKGDIVEVSIEGIGHMINGVK